MWKRILRSIIAVLLYFIILKLLGILFSFALVREEFLNIDETYLYFIDTVVYLVLIALAFLFSKKWDGGGIKRGDISLKIIFLVLAIAILYRFLEDPLLRMGVIYGSEVIPLLDKNDSTSTIEYVSLLLNIVFLGAIFEELLFRKIILDFFASKYLLLGTFVSSVLFALIHVKGSHIDYTTLFSAFLLGLLACVICIRYGLIYSILLHMGYNFIWLLLGEYKTEYWGVLKGLDFGFLYWSIVIASLCVIIFFVYRNIKYIRDTSIEEL